MKNFINQLKRAKGWLLIMSVVFILLTFSTFKLVTLILKFNNFFNVIRYGVIAVLVIIWLIFTQRIIKSLFIRKIKRYTRISIVAIIYSIIILVGTSYADNALSKLDSFTATKTTFSSSIVVNQDDSADSVEDIEDYTIGMLNDTNSVDGNQIPKEIIEEESLKNEIAEYSDYLSLLEALINDEVDAVFLPTNYVTMFEIAPGYEEIGSTTKIIYTKDKEVEVEKRASKDLSEPFTILLMGVDGVGYDVSGGSYNGDSLMLITFNPTTLSTTMMSIPRDTYVPISCFANNKKNKITHAAWYGEDCMIETIEDFTGIEIDYYAKINFKGVVTLVDTLGGIDVNIPIGFCEQDSNRDFVNLQCLDAGEQTINGEEALAWARHRKSAGFNDFVRGENQQAVVEAIANKLLTIRDINQILEILETLGTTIETNMTSDEMLSLFSVAEAVYTKSSDLSSDELFSIQRLTISGHDQYVYDYSQLDGSGSRMNLYNYVPYEQSIKDVSEAMKINLGLIEREAIKEFSFDINEPYIETTIGEGSYSKSSISLLPSFVGEDESVARSWASRNGMKFVVKETTGSTIGQIVSQELPAGKMDLENMTTLTVTVVKELSSDKELDNEDEDKDSEKEPETDTELPDELDPTVPEEEPTTPDVEEPTVPDTTPEEPSTSTDCVPGTPGC